MAEISPESDVLFLLGAGASKAAGIPDTYEFVDAFRRSLRGRPADLNAVDEVVRRLKRWAGRDVDVELLLEALTRLQDREQDPGLLFCRDPSSGRSSVTRAAPRLASALRDYIKRATFVDSRNTAYLDPLMSFVRHHGCLDIATLNYDTAVEEFGHRNHVEVHDGFSPHWNVDALRTATSGIRLYKLHGSVTWYETHDGQYVKDRARVDRSRVRLVQGGVADSVMLFPIRKWAYSEPMVGLLLEFKRLLESPRLRFLVVVGYSFRDEHVQGVVRDATRNNTGLEVVIVDPRAHAIRQTLFNAKSVRWPEHVRRRVVCLPYRFEAVAPLLKHHFLRNLRSGADAERTAELEEASSGSADHHWHQASLHFAEAEHGLRCDIVAKRSRARASGSLETIHALGVALTNHVVGGIYSPRAAARTLVRELERTIVAGATVDYNGGEAVRVRIRDRNGHHEPDEVVRRLSLLDKRCRASFVCGVTRMAAAADEVLTPLTALRMTVEQLQSYQIALAWLLGAAGVPPSLARKTLSLHSVAMKRNTAEDRERAIRSAERCLQKVLRRALRQGVPAAFPVVPSGK